MQSSQTLKVKEILAEAVKRGAADLHFSVGNSPVLRVGGELSTMDDREPITKEFMESFVESLLNDWQKKKLAESRELILTYDFDKNLRFKVNIFFQRGFLSATLRHISLQVPTLDFLGLNPILKELVNLKRGLVIISGPFGSGRSTTVAAMIEEINQTRREYIITIEDPIEYVFSNNKSIIEQREIGSDANTFEDALNYFEEEDGDVLFLEEMSHSALVPKVLEIARGSALVLTTLSASSASNTVARILDSFTTFDQDRVRRLLSSALKAIVCQKILPKIGGGVVVASEIMLVNEAIQSIITSGNISQIDNIIQTSRREGMISFEQVLAELIKKGKISSADAVENSADKKMLNEMME
ncbi:MAG: PilT/PilU family type 4a pilus ATPase [Patescibacteria group bacterium]